MDLSTPMIPCLLKFNAEIITITHLFACIWYAVSCPFGHCHDDSWIHEGYSKSYASYEHSQCTTHRQSATRCRRALAAILHLFSFRYQIHCIELFVWASPLQICVALQAFRRYLLCQMHYSSCPSLDNSGSYLSSIFHTSTVAASPHSLREAPWSSGRALALDAARPRSIPGLGGENY